MDTTTQSRIRWFQLTPGRFVLLLLAVDVLLWLSDRFGWLGWHKGYAVLTGVAAVGVAMILMAVWFAVALIFRRRFQFSLRSLLVLVVVVAVPFSWLGIEIKRTKRQGDAVAAIEKFGGTVEYDWQGDANGKRVRNAQPQGPKWLRALLGVDIFGQVRSIEAREVDLEHDQMLTNNHFTDADLENIRDMPQVEVLSIGLSDVTDAGLWHLEGFGHLRHLELFGTKATDAGLGHLAKLGQLQELNLWETQVTDAGLPYLAGLNQLRRLNLNETQVTDAGLRHLVGLRHLETLNLYGTKVSDAGIAKLQRALPDCKITR